MDANRSMGMPPYEILATWGMASPSSVSSWHTSGVASLAGTIIRR